MPYETKKGDTSFVCNNQMLIREEGEQGLGWCFPKQIFLKMIVLAQR